MKKKYLLPLLALGLPLLGLARPASPGPVTYTNPDGTVTQICLYGDEHFSYVTNVDGTRILELDAKGFWAPAVRNGKMLTPVEADLDMLRAELPVDEVNIRAHRMADRDSEGRTVFPTHAQDVHSPVILVEFSDIPFTVPNTHETFERMLNEKGFSDYGAKGSARDYYEASSNGKFTPIFDVYGPVTLSHDAAYYVGRGSGLIGAGKYARIAEAWKEAVDKLTAQGVDFSIYDYDNNNEVDNIFFFYSGYGQADSGLEDTIWPHQSDYSLQARRLNLPDIYFGDVKFGPYACSNELNYKPPYGQAQPYLDGIGAFCHEFGHVLGLPDLYDTQYQGGATSYKTKTPGKWSVMDNGSYNDNSTCPPVFSGYEQWLCRWIEYTDPEEGAHYSLPPLSSDDRQVLRLRVRRNTTLEQYTSEYFVIENRADLSWDQSLPTNGLVAWRIDYVESNWKSNTVNSFNNPHVEVIGANEANDQWSYPTEDGRYIHIIPGNPGALKPSINTPYFKCFITDITLDPETQYASFDYNKYTESPDVAPVLHDKPTRAEKRRMITLTWDPVEGADSYFVNVVRTDSRGREYFVDGFEEKNVGNVTSCNVGEINQISTAAFSQEFTAYVRANVGIPSLSTSNVIKFVPANLDLSGVEDVTIAELGVCGLKGRIQAPADAEIYNMSGVRTGADNLPAGVYLVKVGSSVGKVVVR